MSHVAERERIVLDAVEAHRDALVETVRQLVRINTVNPYSGEDACGDEAAGQDAIEGHLRALGARIRRFEPPTDTYARANVIGPRNRSWKGRPNVVGEWEFGDPAKGPAIILVGHIDTVGVQGMGNPFGAELREGAIWGRGTSDDKGGLASGLAAVEALLATAEGLNGRLIYMSVVDEECNGSGAGIIACAREGIRADMAVSLDGGDLEIVRGCNGCLTAEVTVHGVAGHGALGNGVNAIEKGMHVARAIVQFGEERRTAHPGCLLNLGTFRGGTLPPVIPGEARMGMNIVYDIDEAAAAEDRTGVWGGRLVWDALMAAIREAEAHDDWLREHASDVEWIKDLVPYSVPEDAPVVVGMREAARDVLKREPKVTTMVAWTDSCWLSVLAGTPIVVFSGANESTVHGPDENIRIDDLVQATKAVALYLYRALSGV